jgi:hypothetical protein
MICFIANPSAGQPGVNRSRAGGAPQRVACPADARKLRSMSPSQPERAQRRQQQLALYNEWWSKQRTPAMDAAAALIASMPASPVILRAFEVDVIIDNFSTIAQIIDLVASGGIDANIPHCFELAAGNIVNMAIEARSLLLSLAGEAWLSQSPYGNLAAKSLPVLNEIIERASSIESASSAHVEQLREGKPPAAAWTQRFKSLADKVAEELKYLVQAMGSAWDIAHPSSAFQLGNLTSGPTGLSSPSTDDGAPFYPSVHFLKFKIEPDTIRQAAHSGKIRKVKKGKRLNHYSEPDARNLWPHKFQNGI